MGDQPASNTYFKNEKCLLAGPPSGTQPIAKLSESHDASEGSSLETREQFLGSATNDRVSFQSRESQRTSWGVKLT